MSLPKAESPTSFPSGLYLLFSDSFLSALCFMRVPTYLLFVRQSPLSRHCPANGHVPRALTVRE